MSMYNMMCKEKFDKNEHDEALEYAVRYFKSIKHHKPFRDFPHKWKITSSFGCRFHPVWKIWKFHWGTDIIHKERTLWQPIFAPISGYITTWHNNYGGWQTVVSDGKLRFGFTHLHGPTLKESGTKVKAGQYIGSIGRKSGSESSTGTHVHISIKVKRNGKWIFVDPEEFYKRVGWPIGGSATTYIDMPILTFGGIVLGIVSAVLFKKFALPKIKSIKSMSNVGGIIVGEKGDWVVEKIRDIPRNMIVEWRVKRIISKRGFPHYLVFVQTRDGKWYLYEIKHPKSEGVNYIRRRARRRPLLSL